METKPYKNWWFLACNGLFAILFGLLLIFFTEDVIRSAMFVVGLIIAILGLIFFGVGVFQLKKDRSVAMMILLSICSLFVGVGIMILKDKTLDLIFMLVGIWAVVVGIFQLVVLVNVRQNLSNRNVILFNGLLTMLLGVVMFFLPKIITHFILVVIGIFAVIFGVVMIYLAFAIRKTSMIASKEPTDLPPA
ncbi:MAG: DUF308 domain-containing protein [Bacteroidetes bacterium]|nr:DUF308 domain-containing protein [Bacteroidota bacterium]